MTELLYKGVEILPALSAPEQVSNLFPDYKNTLGITSKVKEIDAPNPSNN